jgi:hypothetical protein
MPREKTRFLENNRTFVSSFESILESTALIKYVAAIITPIALAFSKKIVPLTADILPQQINSIFGILCKPLCSVKPIPAYLKILLNSKNML